MVLWITLVCVAVYLIIGVIYSEKALQRLEEAIEKHENGEELSSNEEDILNQLKLVNMKMKNSAIAIKVTVVILWLPFKIADLFRK